MSTSSRVYTACEFLEEKVKAARIWLRVELVVMVTVTVTTF